MPSSASRRVVLTGVGFVSPLGNDPETLLAALTAGRSGVTELQSLPKDQLPTRVGGEARHFTGSIDDFGALDPNIKKAIRKGLKLMCREIQMGVAAAQLALQHARLAPGDYDPDRTGVVYGCDYIMTLPEEFTEGIQQCLQGGGFDFSRWAEEGLPKVTPLWLLKYLPNMPASHIAIYNDLRGPNNSITLREASANLAIAEAYHTISRDSADTVIAGATGTRIHPLRTLHVALQEELARGDDDPASLSRPFDVHRTGMVLGEGAGAIVLQELELARQRGATILGEIVGYGSSTVMSRDGAGCLQDAVRNVLHQALYTSGLDINQIGHIHAHGMSTRRSDAAEAQAIASVFVERREPLPVTAAKSNFGNLGAGSGLVECISSALAMHRGELFPLRNYHTPDPECPIHAARAGDAAGASFINLNVTPHGQASAVVIRRCD